MILQWDRLHVRDVNKWLSFGRFVIIMDALAAADLGVAFLALQIAVNFFHDLPIQYILVHFFVMSAVMLTIEIINFWFLMAQIQRIVNFVVNLMRTVVFSIEVIDLWLLMTQIVRIFYLIVNLMLTVMLPFEIINFWFLVA